MRSESINRAYWRYTLPAVVALMVSGTYQVVDGIFIGHVIGAPGLAAITMAWPWVGVLLAAGMMIGVGIGAQCSIAQGAGKTARAEAILGQGAWLLLLVGMPIGGLMLAGSGAFLSLQGAPDEVLALGRDYLHVMGWASPLVMASLALPFWVRNLGAPRLATLAMVVGALANILLDYVFIMWLEWGLYGAAWATVLAESLVILVCLIFLLGRTGPLMLRWQPLKLRLCQDVLGTGFSSMLMYLYISVVVVLHNMLLMQHGSAMQVAAYAIAGYLLAFYYMLAEGVANGMQPLISYFHGARQPANIKRVLRLGLYSALGIGGLMTVALVVQPAWFAAIFVSGDDNLLRATASGIRLHLFALFLDGFVVLAACFFQAMGLGRQAILITLSNMLIQLPFLAVLPLFLGLQGVWLALPLSNVVLSSLVLVMVVRQWRRFGREPSGTVRPATLV